MSSPATSSKVPPLPATRPTPNTATFQVPSLDPHEPSPLSTPFPTVRAQRPMSNAHADKPRSRQPPPRDHTKENPTRSHKLRKKNMPTFTATYAENCLREVGGRGGGRPSPQSNYLKNQQSMHEYRTRITNFPNKRKCKPNAGLPLPPTPPRFRPHILHTPTYALPRPVPSQSKVSL